MRPMIGSSQSGRSAPNASAAIPRAMTTRAVAQGVERAEADGLDLVPRQERLSRAVATAAARASPRPGPTSWARTSVRPPWAWWSPEIGRCCSWWAASAAPRGGGGARDVGDRGDVVPVDAVADPEDQPGDEDPDGRGIEARARSRSCAEVARSGTGYPGPAPVATCRTNNVVRRSDHGYAPGAARDHRAVTGSASACRSRSEPVQSVVRTEVRSCGDVWIRQGLAPGEREPRMLLRPR